MQCATIQNFFGWFELATQCLFCRLQWGYGRILGNNFQILNIANHMNIWRWCYTCRKTWIFFCTAKVWNMCIPTNWIMVAKKILGMANQKSGSSKIFHGRCSRKWLHIVISCYIMLYRPPGFLFIPISSFSSHWSSFKKKLLMYWVHTPSIGFWLLVPQLSGFMAGRCSSLPTVGTWKKRNGMRVTGSAKNDVFLYPKMIL